MPNEVTIFAATNLIYVDAALALAFVAYAMFYRPRVKWIRWAIAMGITLVVAYLLAQVGAAVYSDPRPFAQDHVKPLIAHAADNGFPSDHALLAAALVAAVLLTDLRISSIFVVLGVLVDWARVGSGVHHVIDVAGSSIFVALGMLIGYLVAPPITRLLLPHIPERVLGESPQIPGPNTPF